MFNDFHARQNPDGRTIAAQPAIDAEAGNCHRPQLETAVAIVRTDQMLESQGVRIARPLTPSGVASAIVIAIILVPATMVCIVVVRACEVAEAFNPADERVARRAGDWIGDHLRLWWQSRRDRESNDGLRDALDLFGFGV